MDPLLKIKTNSLEELLSSVDWPRPSGPVLGRMERAFRFITTHERRALDKVEVESPFVLPRPPIGKAPPFPTLRVVTLLQAMDFDQEVTTEVLPVGTALARFMPADTPRAGYARGRWFTVLHQELESLALPRGRFIRREFRVKRPAPCLHSRVSDAFTWVAMDLPNQRGQARDFGVDYLRGGGHQTFLPDAESYVEWVGR